LKSPQARTHNKEELKRIFDQLDTILKEIPKLKTPKSLNQYKTLPIRNLVLLDSLIICETIQAKQCKTVKLVIQPSNSDSVPILIFTPDEVHQIHTLSSNSCLKEKNTFKLPQILITLNLGLSLDCEYIDYSTESHGWKLNYDTVFQLKDSFKTIKTHRWNLEVDISLDTLGIAQVIEKVLFIE
jgi:hypothetical protein